MWYIGTKLHMDQESTARKVVERVQTGVRLEKRLLKVLKALADYHDLTLGDLIEGIVLHAFEGRSPFSDHTRERIGELKKVFGLHLTTADAHRLDEARPEEAPS